MLRLVSICCEKGREPSPTPSGTKSNRCDVEKGCKAPPLDSNLPVEESSSPTEARGLRTVVNLLGCGGSHLELLARAESDGGQNSLFFREAPGRALSARAQKDFRFGEVPHGGLVRGKFCQQGRCPVLPLMCLSTYPWYKRANNFDVTG